MHFAHNSIRDSIKLFKPNQSKPYFLNKTKRPAVISSCRLLGIFLFVTRENDPLWPWMLPKECAKLHDSQFDHVLGI